MDYTGGRLPQPSLENKLPQRSFVLEVQPSVLDTTETEGSRVTKFLEINNKKSNCRTIPEPLLLLITESPRNQTSEEVSRCTRKDNNKISLLRLQRFYPIFHLMR